LLECSVKFHTFDEGVSWIWDTNLVPGGAWSHDMHIPGGGHVVGYEMKGWFLDELLSCGIGHDEVW
jgi:hypothetical protein